MVAHMTDDERRELAELYAADDRLRAEHADWLARREAAAASPVLLYRTTEQNVPAPAPQPGGAADSQPSGALFGDWRDQALSEAMGVVIVETRREMRKERDAALAERDARIAKLEVQIEMLLALLGKSDTVSHLKAADVVDLPRGFLRRIHNNAA